MNPASNETPGMQLPPPIMEQPPAQNTPDTRATQTPEMRMAAGPEAARLQGTSSAPMPAIPLPAQPTAQAGAAQDDVSGTTPMLALSTARDSDLIEKEWVSKAKQIVERTRDDPYRQSEQLTEVKVDYMKKRYGKTIKLSK